MIVNHKQMKEMNVIGRKSGADLDKLARPWLRLGYFAWSVRRNVVSSFPLQKLTMAVEFIPGKQNFGELYAKLSQMYFSCVNDIYMDKELRIVLFLLILKRFFFIFVYYQRKTKSQEIKKEIQESSLQK